MYGYGFACYGLLAIAVMSDLVIESAFGFFKTNYFLGKGGFGFLFFLGKACSFSFVKVVKSFEGVPVLGFVTYSDNLNGFYFITLRDAIHYVLTFYHLAKNGVLTVQPRGRYVGDEELTAIGARTGICHREYASFVVF